MPCRTDKKRAPIAVILLQYCSGRDTLHCLDSLLKTIWPGCVVVVVDNASPDDSWEILGKWKEEHPEESVHILRSPTNSGFAAGNNFGYQYARQLGKEFSFYWFLNNDTEVELDSPLELVEYAEDAQASGRKLGILGAKLLLWQQRDTLQGVGGTLIPWLAYPRLLGGGERDIGQYDKGLGEKKIDYVIGASMFVSAKFLEEVGPMYEGFFLYFEELDWCIRARKQGWTVEFCPRSRVWHKEGASIGSNVHSSARSAKAEFYGHRARVLFTKRHYPWYLPTVLLSMTGVVLLRVVRKQWGRIPLVLRATLSGLFTR